MNNRQTAIYAMVRRLVAFIKANLAAFASFPLINSLLTSLENALTQIDALKEIQGTTITGIKIKKDTLRANAIQKALEMISALLLYAKISGNEILADEIDYTETDLSRGSDNKLEIDLSVVIKNTQLYLAQLADYGVTPEKAAAFKEAFDAFKATIGSPKDGAIARKQATEQRDVVYEDLMKTVGKIDLVVETLRFSNPPLYASYTDNRRIDTHSGSLTVKVKVIDQLTGTGVENVKVSFMLDGVVKFEKTTAAGGGLSIKSLGEGNYTVTFSKIGYATQTLNVSITGDALNTIDVTLVKLNS